MVCIYMLFVGLENLLTKVPKNLIQYGSIYQLQMTQKTILKMDGTVNGEKIEMKLINKPLNGDSDVTTTVVAEMYADLFIDIERAAKRLSYNLGLPLDDCIVSQTFIRDDGSILYDELPETIKSCIQDDVFSDDEKPEIDLIVE